jgi:chemotaxis methyl-accepting protein methylase/PAS domain-containing protein
VVVGIGGSAGGLHAFSTLLEHLAPDTGMAFVIVSHLDPGHPSLLTQLLASKTQMAVAEATDKVRIAPNRVYVTPPGTQITIDAGRLRLSPRAAGEQRHLPIDAFLESLAAAQGQRAIGVILSGAASDGARGLIAIKSAGGLAFAQEPASAEYPSMPARAIATGVVDFVLVPEKIAVELAAVAAHSYLGAPRPRAPLAASAAQEAGALGEIFELLRAALGVDFSAYKLSTIRRRVARRMALHHLTDVDAYVGYLRGHPAELQDLYHDILIMVTEFFRDPETFDVLRKRVIPAILSGKPEGAAVRVWVAGCASGEEAYSLAFTLLDVMAERGISRPLKIFATDISERDLERARRGLYPESIADTVSPKLLQRYFVEVEGGYQVGKMVREACVFARHDLTRDPPFARLDLLSCRNVLIYMGAALQRRVVPLLHYGLLPGGYLMLGRAESLGSRGALFEAVDAKHRIFTKKPGPSPQMAPFASAPPMLEGRLGGQAELSEGQAAVTGQGTDIAGQAERAVLADFVPPGVTVDSALKIVRFSGETAPFETSSEELQSTNEELQIRNSELWQANDDLGNLLTSITFPIIMVGRDLRVRHFTPGAERLLKVTKGDVGRPIGELALHADLPDLKELLREVIDTVTPIERDVRDAEGRFYSAQVRPYETADHRIDGAILTLIDIDEITRRFEAQLRIAVTLQENFVHALPEVAGLEFAAHSAPAHRLELVGGDFHDVFELTDGLVLATIGDVAGKGVAAAGLAETVRAAARALALVSPAPEWILTQLNRVLLREAEHSQLVTALLVTLDSATGELSMASAGHPAPVRLGEGHCAMIDPLYGPPLGAFETDYQVRSLGLAPGEALVLYTDGATEARRDGELFGEQRLIDTVCSATDNSPSALVARLHDAVTSFAGELQDDLQILALRRGSSDSLGAAASDDAAIIAVALAAEPSPSGD